MVQYMCLCMYIQYILYIHTSCDYVYVAPQEYPTDAAMFNRPQLWSPRSELGRAAGAGVRVTLVLLSWRQGRVATEALRRTRALR